MSPYKSPATGYLVVDGYISGNGVTQYTLTRTMPLNADSAVPVVTGAHLQIEGSDSSVFPLAEDSNGVYSVGSIQLNITAEYRLRVALSGGETYLSEFVPYKPTPPIDSVTWSQDGTGVNIYVNTHDPANSTRYYEWAFDQTFEYHSAEFSSFIYIPSTQTVVPRTAAQQVSYCWTELPPTSLVVGSSSQLAQDVIHQFPLLNIPPDSKELSVEYSVLVSQYALSDSGFQFLSRMAQISQALGSIFDPLPDQLTGNIHSLSNPNEPVIGYIQAGTVQQQRIFISNQQVQNWVYYYACPGPDTIVATTKAALEHFFGTGSYVPLSANYGPKPPVPGWIANGVGCVDCTTQGGSNQKPPWWPN